jgi:hypothetical protein
MPVFRQNSSDERAGQGLSNISGPWTIKESPARKTLADLSMNSVAVILQSVGIPPQERFLDNVSTCYTAETCQILNAQAKAHLPESQG